MHATQAITIRPLTPADILAVADVERAVYGSAAYSPIYIRQLYDLFPSLIWVAVDGTGKVVGHVFGAIEEGGQVGWVLNFAVLPHCRRLGAGRRLVETALQQLTAAGVARIKTTCEPDNDDAQRLYARLGFTPIGTGADYYADGDPRLLFERPPLTTQPLAQEP